MLHAGPAGQPMPEAEAFVRFCYERRRVGWPELYDEMCAVATRGLFRGMGHDALSEIGVGFSLFQTPRLAELVKRITAEEQAARRATRAAALEAARQEDGVDAASKKVAAEDAPAETRRPDSPRPRQPDRVPGRRRSAPRALGTQARMRRRAISPSIWRSAST